MSHYAREGTLEPDRHGWFYARYSCGFKSRFLTSSEDVLDTLMDHARDVTRAKYRARTATTGKG